MSKQDGRIIGVVRENNVRTRQPAPNSNGKPKSSIPPNKSQEQSDNEEMYGTVVSFKETFGFVQAFMSDEDVYFSAREAPGIGKIGDEVSFRRQNSARGIMASSVKAVAAERKQCIDTMTGIIIREAEAHRGQYGAIELITADGIDTHTIISYFFEDIFDKTKRLKKGDTVSFSYYFIPNSNYNRAKNVKLILTKRDKLISEQLQSFINEGKKCEQGHIESLSGDYGFIRSADRSDVQLYFRQEDIIDNDIGIKEGKDVEYYIIKESSKGKQHDRAVHIKILPDGTIQLECPLTTNVQGTVIQEPKLHPHEHPGSIRLKEPLSIPGHKTLEIIELWPRCCPDNFIVRAGDIINFDVIHYRPEKLYFARNVIMKSYRKIGREYGKVCRVKDQGFGFLHSSIRDMDIYFRTGEVIDSNGHILRENEVTQDMIVSYDVITEENGRNSNNNNTRYSLRAIRVRTENSLEDETSRTKLKKKDIRGIIVREAKKDVPGLIRATTDISDMGPTDEDLLSTLYEAILEFQNFNEIKEIFIDNIPPAQRRLYYILLDEKFNNIAYNTISTPAAAGSDSKAKTLKLWKLDDTKFALWKSTKAANPVIETGTNTTSSITYLKNDVIVNTELGPMIRDKEVSFDLYLDKRTGKLVGRAVSLTDYPALDSPGIHYGITEILAKNKTGFIRVIATDEKLSWNTLGCSSSSSSNTNGNGNGTGGSHGHGHVHGHSPVKAILGGSGSGSGSTTGVPITDNTEVSFEIRIRGGVRTASSVTPLLPIGSLRKEELLPGVCTAIVVDELHVVLADVTGCPLLASKYVDLIKASNVPKGAAGKHWEHVSVPEKGGGTGSGGEKGSGEKGTGGDKSSDKVVGDKMEQHVTSVSSSVMYSDRKYYGTLVRAPIAMDCTIEERKNLMIGELIKCQVVVDWALQRYPIRVTAITRLDPAKRYGGSGRRRGIITKLKLPLSFHNSGETLFWHEITETMSSETTMTTSGGGGGGNGHYVVDSREAHGLNGGELHRGDTVEFVIIPGTRVALMASYIGQNTTSSSSSSSTAGTSNTGGATAGANGSTSTSTPVKDNLLLCKDIENSRTPINAELKATVGISGGIRCVSMAQ
eukprot:gene11521-24091_t